MTDSIISLRFSLCKIEQPKNNNGSCNFLSFFLKIELYL